MSIALVNNAHASGFMIPEISVTAIGFSNALVANPEELGAIPFNPSAMAFHKGHSLSGGIKIFMPDMFVTTATGKHQSQIDDKIPIPDLQATFQATDQLYVGLGVSAPFGLETNWPVGTFPQLSQPMGPLPDGSFIPPGAFHPTQSKLELANVTPTLAYRVNENFSISAGLDYYKAKKVKFNTGLVNVEGDGDEWGWNISAMYADGPLSLGASFHSEIDIDLDGNFTRFLGPSIPADAVLKLPSRFQIGIRYAFTDKLAAEFDFSRLGWETFDSIVVTAKANGAVLVNSEGNWEDANAYRFGLSYKLTDATRLSFGYTYDQTGQNMDYFSARIPDADRHLFGVGIAHSFGSGWTVEGAYMYGKAEDVNYTGNRPFNPLAPDSNGTTAIDGKYEADVQIFGIGVSKQFD